MRRNRINVYSMGCSKNLVDSERLIRKLEDKGYDLVFEPEEAEGDYTVVNTCGFIGDAKEESINLILSLCEKKKEGKVGKVVVMGCLSERYREELRESIPEVDIWYGKFDWKGFSESLPDIACKEGEETPASGTKDWERTLTTPPHSCYLKISEGCNRFCAFCAIPLITGRHTSRPIEEIEEEVRRLVSEGVREFNVIAQDLSSYGLDLYGRHALPELIDRIADIPGVEWIRLHYAYPTDFPYGILDVMARRDNVCKYLDIALQHIADPVLTNMRRHISGEETRRLIEEIRNRVPGIKLRTTMMVGFPGEGEKEFEELLEFVKEARFDRLGAFAYCEEDDTWAAKNLSDDIPEDVKQDRLDRLMAVQQQIAEELNADMVGKTVRVLVDRVEEQEGSEQDEKVYVGRTQWDSPEVDQEVSFTSPRTLQPGDFTDVRITSAFEFDLEGEGL